MATQLKNIVRFTALVVSTPQSLPHGLNLNGRALLPDLCVGSHEGITITADDTNVTVTRDSDAAADAIDVFTEYWHSENRNFGPFSKFQPAGLIPRPFIIPQNGTGGTALIDATEIIHKAIAGPGQLRSFGANAPVPEEAGNLLYLEFALDTARAFRTFKIGRDFVDTPSLHVHWTKSRDNINEQGNTVQWQIDYTVFDGRTQLASTTGTLVTTAVLTYLDDSTLTDRFVYRSLDLPLVGIVADYYVTCKITAITPSSGTPLTDPGLVSLDMKYRARINGNFAP